MPGRFMKLADTGIHSIRYKFPRETETGQGPLGASQMQSNLVGNADHTDEPPTREDLYFTVSNGMANHFASPIPLTPLQHLSSLAPSLCPLIPSTSIFPRSLIIFSFVSPISHLPFRLSTLPNPLSARHLSVTSLSLRTLPKVTRIAVSACHYIKTSPTLDGLYSSIDNFKLRRSEPDLPSAEEYSSHLSVRNPFPSVFRVHPELG